MNSSEGRINLLRLPAVKDLVVLPSLLFETDLVTLHRHSLQCRYTVVKLIFVQDTCHLLIPLFSPSSSWAASNILSMRQMYYYTRAHEYRYNFLLFIT